MQQIARLDIDPFDKTSLADPYAHHADLREICQVANTLRAIGSLPVECVADAALQ